jgi:hypothetical protein
MDVRIADDAEIRTTHLLNMTLGTDALQVCCLEVSGIAGVWTAGDFNH